MSDAVFCLSPQGGPLPQTILPQPYGQRQPVVSYRQTTRETGVFIGDVDYIVVMLCYLPSFSCVVQLTW